MIFDLYKLKFSYRRILIPFIEKLKWIHPDIVSYAAVIVAAATGFCFYQAKSMPSLLIVAIILTLLRMTLNTLDGLIAINRGNLSLKGEIVNALPDRYSDIFIMIGIALSPLCNIWLGIGALCSVLLVSYTGMLGKAVGVSWQHQGPAGKVERLIILMVFALFQFILLPERSDFTIFGITATPVEWAAGLIIVLGQYSVLRRVRGQVKEINIKEAQEHIQNNFNEDKAIVIYDSVTGNTRKVAEHIAMGITCSAKSVFDVKDISKYNLVVLGTPNIRKCPTHAIQQFQKSIEIRPPLVAYFVTYGLPLWGRITGTRCLKFMAGTWNVKQNKLFLCPGFHKKYKTYKKRPNDSDLNNAFLFGYKLSKTLSQYRSVK
jgi:archaetidylinositol phosphate synthase